MGVKLACCTGTTSFVLSAYALNEEKQNKLFFNVIFNKAFRQRELITNRDSPTVSMQGNRKLQGTQRITALILHAVSRKHVAADNM